MIECGDHTLVEVVISNLLTLLQSIQFVFNLIRLTSVLICQSYACVLCSKTEKLSNEADIIYMLDCKLSLEKEKCTLTFTDLQIWNRRQ